jgi:hypothetical protein
LFSSSTLGYDGVALGGVDRRKSLEAKVDNVHNLLFRKFAVKISGILNECSVLVMTRGEEA